MSVTATGAMARRRGQLEARLQPSWRRCPSPNKATASKYGGGQGAARRPPPPRHGRQRDEPVGGRSGGQPQRESHREQPFRSGRALPASVPPRRQRSSGSGGYNMGSRIFSSMHLAVRRVRRRLRRIQRQQLPGRAARAAPADGQPGWRRRAQTMNHEEQIFPALPGPDLRQPPAPRVRTAAAPAAPATGGGNHVRHPGGPRRRHSRRRREIDTAAMKQILGSDGVDLVVTDDPVLDKKQSIAFAAHAP